MGDLSVPQRAPRQPLAAGVLELLRDLGDPARRPLVITLRLANLPLRPTKRFRGFCELAFELLDSSSPGLARRLGLGFPLRTRLRRRQRHARQRIERSRLDLVRQHAWRSNFAVAGLVAAALSRGRGAARWHWTDRRVLLGRSRRLAVQGRVGPYAAARRRRPRGPLPAARRRRRAADEIGLLPSKTVREEDGLRWLAQLCNLRGLVGPTLVAQAPLQALALGDELLRLDRVELLEDVRCPSLPADGLEALHRRHGGDDGHDTPVLAALKADELTRLAVSRARP